ncbi:MAG: PaaI family thioesterase [Candidatus Zixiibacteriota bacterium]
MKEVVKYSGCFVCGDKNENGLKARFYFDGEQAFTDVVAQKQFEGYSGIYHRGIVSTLLDEVMIKAILAQDRFAVTAEMTVRFLQPIRTGDKITLAGKVTKSKGRVFFTEGKVTAENGQTLATATGRYVEVDTKLKAALMSSVE